jgi:acetate kinase
MRRNVVTLNAGSSSLKFALFEVEDLTPHLVSVGLAETVATERHFSVRDAKGALVHEEKWEIDDSPFHIDALHRVINFWQSSVPKPNIVAAGHRVVHGGVLHGRPITVTDAVLADLRALVPLAPLHQPHNVRGIEAAREAWPNVPHVACFDTSFHRVHSFVNDAYALPRHLYDEGVRRYGFHGLSYESIIARLREIAPLHAAGRVVVAHLGNGASMCAIRDGHSVACTMGFGTLDGLAMGTRCGQIDPCVLLYLMQEKGMNADEISDLLHNKSGLKGLSGVSNDMRELEASPLREAAETIDYFVSRIRYALGGLAAEMKGLDAVVFCGGIGQHAWRVREAVMKDQEWLGIGLDRPANLASAEVISTEHSAVRVFVLASDEEATIARHTVAILDRTEKTEVLPVH